MCLVGHKCLGFQTITSRDIICMNWVKGMRSAHGDLGVPLCHIKLHSIILMIALYLSFIVFSIICK